MIYWKTIKLRKNLKLKARKGIVSETIPIMWKDEPINYNKAEMRLAAKQAFGPRKGFIWFHSGDHINIPFAKRRNARIYYEPFAGTNLLEINIIISYG
jgi:hypothetical protein